MLCEVAVHRVVKSCKQTGQYIEPHTHGFFHYIYALSGHTQVSVGDEIFQTRQGTLVMVPPGVVHGIISRDTSSCLDLKFSCSEASQALLTQLPYCVAQVDEQSNGLLRHIFDEAVGQGWGYEDLVSLYLEEVLLLLLRQQRQGRQCGPAADWRLLPSGNETVQSVLRLVEERLETPLRVSALAEHCGYSENYFRQFFKENVGISPNGYINQRKIAQAKEWMLYTDLNVTQISQKLGYQSIHYFSRRFKQVTGISPTQYIARVKENRSINVLQNQNTPADEFELPIKGPSPASQPAGD